MHVVLLKQNLKATLSTYNFIRTIEEAVKEYQPGHSSDKIRQLSERLCALVEVFRNDLVVCLYRHVRINRTKTVYVRQTV